jgi:transcriptional regulator with XRE-family HTH domain
LIVNRLKIYNFMENNISVNINFLLKKEKLTQDDFGALFDLKKGVINQYLLKKSNPKIETLIKICDYFKFSLDDLVRKDLSEPIAVGIKQGEVLYANEPVSGYPEVISPRYVESLERIIVEKDQALKDKQKIIEMLEEKINPDKRKQA